MITSYCSRFQEQPQDDVLDAEQPASSGTGKGVVAPDLVAAARARLEDELGPEGTDALDQRRLGVAAKEGWTEEEERTFESLVYEYEDDLRPLVRTTSLSFNVVCCFSCMCDFGAHQ